MVIVLSKQTYDTERFYLEGRRGLEELHRLTENPRQNKSEMDCLTFGGNSPEKAEFLLYSTPNQRDPTLTFIQSSPIHPDETNLLFHGQASKFTYETKERITTELLYWYMIEQFAAQNYKTSEFSKREIEIELLERVGASTDQISELLNISESTITNDQRSIQTKRKDSTTLLDETVFFVPPFPQKFKTVAMKPDGLDHITQYTPTRTDTLTIEHNDEDNIVYVTYENIGDPITYATKDISVNDVMSEIESHLSTHGTRHSSQIYR